MILAGLWWIGRRAAIEPRPPIASQIPDEWALTTGTYDGKPIITRFNKGLDAIAGHPSYGKQLGIAVPLRQPTEDGFPNAEEVRQLDQLEEEFRRRLILQNQCLFAGVISTGNMREFVFYTSDAAASSRIVQQLAKETAHYEIQHVVNDDPKWNVYRSLLQPASPAR